MAHFFDAVSYAPLVTYELHPKETKTVGLWGGDFLGNDLTVVIDPDLINMKEKKMRQNNCRFFDLTALKVGKTSLRAFAGQIDFAFPIETSVTKLMTTPQGNLTVRRMIVDEAIKHVDAGAHYLWGTAGNTPGRNDGLFVKYVAARMKPNSFGEHLNPVSKPVTTVNAAWASIGEKDKPIKYSICAGRSKFVPIQNKALTDVYLARAKKENLSADPYSPRTYLRDNTTPAEAKCVPGYDGVVWGENCAGKRHFDCIGLVNYCIAECWSGGREHFGVDIPSLWTANGHYGLAPVSDPDDVLNADIISHYDGTRGWNHIAMVYFDGKQAKVVQAADGDVGLTKEQPYIASEWGTPTLRRLRLRDNQIRTPITTAKR